jgi:putative transposase
MRWATQAFSMCLRFLTKVGSQRWMTFVRNHAKAIIAADFFVVVTATFQFVYVLVVMEIETRRVVHLNVTRHPTADWTMQQFRECVIGDEG